MDPIDAVILAAGRLSGHEAERAGVEIKALARIGETTPLAAVIAAMRSSAGVRRVIVVGPDELQAMSVDVDSWVSERPSGEENVLAGLAAAQTRRVLVSASDVPFIAAEMVDDFLNRVPADADFAYPVYEREEFLALFPAARSKFARVGDARFTGGSLCLMNVAVALRNAGVIRRAFAARKSVPRMASLLGFGCLWRYATGHLDIAAIE
ncbi:MAG TPA: NTP transferase domain-containing protein, partial [Candidatus Eremiobacteraceae bacterium]|nr:NTP transferase domain-containing protein [Candidatus Eremiobacteraceae bacterium]